MPYELRHGLSGCSGWAVVLKGTGKIVPGGCHPTRAEAVKHLRALHANVPEAKQDLGLTLNFPDAPGGTMQVGATGAAAAAGVGHEKVGHTGQGLWHRKGVQLPAYIQHIANDLIDERGMDESRAIATAVNRVKVWCAGGGGVKADTQAKACAAAAEWEALKTSASAAGIDLEAAWNPSAHPRAPAGGSTGGQFAPGSGGAAPTNAKPVGEGEAGKRVSDLQKRLNALGAKLAVDGKFGPATLAAVRAYQKTHGLKVDGLVGPLTTAALRSKTAPKGKPGTGTATTVKKTPAAKPHAAAEPAAPSLPSLVTIPGVDILAAGTWQLSTGRQTFTRADLEHAVDAARCPAVGNPVIKIGHLDQRFAPGPADDGEPAIGKVANLRLNDAGTKVLGDLAGMPGWLGAITASAYPRRSVEGKYGFKCQVGHTHPFVLTALALLGVTPPGVGVLGGLDDIAALYGLPTMTASAGGWRTDPAEPDREDPMPVTEEDVRRAYYAQAGAPPSWWITELQMAPTQLIVADEDSGQIYRVPFTINGAAVEFGNPDQVVSYEDVAATRGTGPVMVYASAAESRDVHDVVEAASDKPWGDFTQADYTPAQWHAACLIHDHPGGVPDSKDGCKLPVKEPGGAVNRNGVHAAAAALAGARGGVGASAEQKAKAKSALRGLYSQIGDSPPDSLKASAEEDVEAASGDAGTSGMHGDYTGTHTHPHPTTGDQGSDEQHDHRHKHAGDGTHDHAHDTQAAADAAATTDTGGDSAVEFTDDQLAAIRARLGKGEFDPVGPEEIAAALDTPRAPTVAAAAAGDGESVEVPQLTEGTYVVDAEVLRSYQERAIAGDRAVMAMRAGERDTVLAAAIREGKFAQSRKDHFELLWDKDPEGTRKLIGALASGLVPMGPLGSAGEFAGDPDMPGDFESQKAYKALYPDDFRRERTAGGR